MVLELLSCTASTNSTGSDSIAITWAKRAASCLSSNDTANPLTSNSSGMPHLPLRQRIRATSSTISLNSLNVCIRSGRMIISCQLRDLQEGGHFSHMRKLNAIMYAYLTGYSTHLIEKCNKYHKYRVLETPYLSTKTKKLGE